MYKACSRCGRIHDERFKCTAGVHKASTAETRLRNLAAWHRKSEQIRQKAGYLCEVCRDKGIYTFRGLEVHHIDKIRDDQSRLLDDYNLACLCQACHKLADAGQIDKEYLFRLAARREAADEDTPRGV